MEKHGKIIPTNWKCDVSNCKEDAFKENNIWCAKHTLFFSKIHKLNSDDLKEIEAKYLALRM